MDVTVGQVSQTPTTPLQPDAVAYDLGVLGSGNQYTTDDGRILSAESLSGATRMHESSAGLFIVPFTAGAAITTKNQYASAPIAKSDPTTFAALCKSVDLALEKGASVCFLLFPGTPFPYHSSGAGGYSETERVANAEVFSRLGYVDNVIGFRYLDSQGIGLGPTWLQTNIQARANEFMPFMSRYAATEYRLIGEGPDGVDVLATAGDNVVAIAVESGRGRLFWSPMRNPTDPADLVSAITTLVRSIATYKSRRLTEEPAWAREQFIWSGEGQIRKRAAEALAVLEEVEPLQQRWSRLRRVLWARDDALRIAVSDFLREIGFVVEDDERYREDFGLVREGERAAIGEVKGINGNVSPGDLARLVSHRKDAVLPDQFPGIFVALTFANTEVVDKRRIEPNVCRRAREDNILVMRTIDLARFYDGMIQERSGFAIEVLWEALRAGGGWLEVTSETISLRVD